MVAPSAGSVESQKKTKTLQKRSKGVKSQMLRPIGTLKFERTDLNDRLYTTRTASFDELEGHRNAWNEKNFNFKKLYTLENSPLDSVMPPLEK